MYVTLGVQGSCHERKVNADWFKLPLSVIFLLSDAIPLSSVCLSIQVTFLVVITSAQRTAQPGPLFTESQYCVFDSGAGVSHLDPVFVPKYDSWFHRSSCSALVWTFWGHRVEEWYSLDVQRVLKNVPHSVFCLLHLLWSLPLGENKVLKMSITHWLKSWIPYLMPLLNSLEGMSTPLQISSEQSCSLWEKNMELGNGSISQLLTALGLQSSSCAECQKRGFCRGARRKWYVLAKYSYLLLPSAHIHREYWVSENVLQGIILH